MAIYYVENAIGGTDTVTVRQGVADTLRFVLLEYGGVATSNELDVAASTLKDILAGTKATFASL